MLDIATAYNKYGFLGNEFLTWIWYLVETDKDITALSGSKDPITFEIGNSISLENNLGDKSKEKITIKGDQAGLEEGVITSYSIHYTKLYDVPRRPGPMTRGLAASIKMVNILKREAITLPVLADRAMAR